MNINSLANFKEKKHSKSPSWIKVALEARTLLEAGSMALSFPLLQASAKGDGHPVLVLPGFLAGDFSTKFLRTFLKSRNYQSYGWGLGRNLGKHSHPEKGCGDKIVERLHQIYEKHGEKVSLVGWSLGGIYARELARSYPEMIRLVITLGSPHSGDLSANHATWLFERTSGFALHDLAESLRERMSTTPPVPTTSFYSKTDGITAWESCLEETDHHSENIEVPSSHCGMGHHPFVMWAIANRLAQPAGEWKRFEKRGLEHLMFR